MGERVLPRRYNAWAGNPNGTPEDAQRCIAEVRERGGWPSYLQCGRKRGHGPNGEFCAQHAKAIANGKSVDVPR